MRRLYRAFLRLYPADFRVWFAAEMLASFDDLAKQCRSHGQAAYVRFILAELRDVVAGAVAEWTAKLTTDTSVRDRVLPDPRQMPPGIPSDVWFAEKNVEFNLGRMVNAIATHQFEKARFYSQEERKARETLDMLREKYRTVE